MTFPDGLENNHSHLFQALHNYPGCHPHKWCLDRDSWRVEKNPKSSSSGCVQRCLEKQWNSDCRSIEKVQWRAFFVREALFHLFALTHVMEKTKPEILKGKNKKLDMKCEIIFLDRWRFCEENWWKSAFSLFFIRLIMYNSAFSHKWEWEEITV